MNNTQNEHELFNPDTLLDTIKQRLGNKTDAALARRLVVAPSLISKIRHRRQIVSAEVLISMHEETGLSLRDLRLLHGDFRVHTGISAQSILPDMAAAMSVGIYKKMARRERREEPSLVPTSLIVSFVD